MWPRPINRYAIPKLAHEKDQHGAKVFCCPADRGGVEGYPDQKAYTLYGNSYATNIYLIGPNEVPVSTTSNDRAVLDGAINNQIKKMGLNKVTNSPQAVVLMGDYGWHNQFFDRFTSDEIQQQAIALDAACLRGKCEQDHELGYDLMKRFVPVVVERLHATRMQILDVYGNSN